MYLLLLHLIETNTEPRAYCSARYYIGTYLQAFLRQLRNENTFEDTFRLCPILCKFKTKHNLIYLNFIILLKCMYVSLLMPPDIINAYYLYPEISKSKEVWM